MKSESKTSQIFRFGGIYSLANVLQQLLNFVLIPVYTFFLLPEDYGVAGLLSVTAALILSFTKTPTGHGFVRFYYSPEIKTDRKVILFNSMLYSLCNSLIFSILFLVFSEFISKSLFHSNEYSFLIKIYALIIFLQPLDDLFQDLAKLHKKAGLIASIQLINAVFSSSVIIILLYFYHYGVMSLVIGALSTTLINVLCFGFYSFKFISFRIDFKTIKPLLKYGYPLIIAVLSQFLLNNIDQYIINFTLDHSQVGLYIFGYKFGGLLFFFYGAPVKNITEPIIFSLESKRVEMFAFIKDASVFFAFVGLVLWLILSLFVEDIIRLLASNHAYYESWKIVPAVALGYLNFGLLEFFGKGIELSNKTALFSTIYIFTAIMNVILNIIFLPVFGIIAASINTLICFTLLSYIAAYQSKRLYRLDYDLGKIFIMTLIAIAFFGFSIVLSIDNIYFKTLINIILVIVYPITIYFISGGKFREQVRNIYKRIRQIRN
jgi:O-antigen/teichoic acid export membrane protein